MANYDKKVHKLYSTLVVARIKKQMWFYGLTQNNTPVSLMQSNIEIPLPSTLIFYFLGILAVYYVVLTSTSNICK